jgi:adenosylcobalamin-dependent ribonucleoside-triphosphate reductase
MKERIPSVRAQVITRRSYNRPLNETETVFETWPQTVDRVIGHQQWLWERAQGKTLSPHQQSELVELKTLMLSREGSLSGRTLWLGGTEIAKTREASQFNCSGTPMRTVHDVVDHIWLLLQGCGVGFKPQPGILSGFSVYIPEIEIIPSDAEGKTGEDHNTETFVDGVWTIRIGDSAEAWAKAFGKLLAGKYNASKLVLDFRPIRPGGIRLKGYGWISSGDGQLRTALAAIVDILNRRHGQLLGKIDLLDIGNWMGTVLSSRRSAEIALVDYGSSEWEEFALAKKDMWEKGLGHREQSNNTLLFWERPSKLELLGMFQLMLIGGGSEPGFANAAEAKRRAPWFELFNPCAEILLGEHSFCNLVETNLAAFNGRTNDLHRAHYIFARANYRQTCVDLHDGILQDTWHELNEYLRLTGAGVTGVVLWEHEKDPEAWEALRAAAHEGVNSMADELGLPRSKLVTTIKPSGTLSKCMDTTEGVHAPLARHIINNVVFSRHDPLVKVLQDAGYKTFQRPGDPDAILAALPVDWGEQPFFSKKTVTRSYVVEPIVEGEESEIAKVTEEVEVYNESAIDQLERYKMVMDHYVDHNCSITVSYEPDEVPEIVDWLYENWDSFVGISWLLRNDPTKTAADLGYPYLPQEVWTKAEFDEYVAQLKPVNIGTLGDMETELEDECAGGACPIR